MKKKVLTTIILSTLVTTLGVNGLFKTSALATEVAPAQSEINEEIEKNNIEMQDLIDNWDDIEVMSDEEVQQKNLEKMQGLSEYMDEYPELQENFIQTLRADTGNYLGSSGDILITPYGESFSGGSYSGHAGIIDIQWKNTIESMCEDGVQRRVNDWNTRYPKVIAAGVKGAKVGDYLGAMKYAQDRIGFGYNWRFYDKWRTDTFYCSQLVWRAWVNQGFDLDKDGGNFVLPTDLISDKLEINYKNY